MRAYENWVPLLSTPLSTPRCSLHTSPCICPCLQLPKPKPQSADTFYPEAGTAWRDGSVMTVAMTFGFAVRGAAGRVEGVACNWGAVMGYMPDVRDAYDIYIHLTRVAELSHSPEQAD
jgi:hypothetical protein